tara:strand:+ start:280 stop:540 length:261 start_codon:yes stop_codon:yes gene_type:complete
MDNLPLRIKTRRMMAAEDLKTGSRVAALVHFEVSNYYVQNGPKLLTPSSVSNATDNVTISAAEIEGTLRKYLEEYLKKRREDENDF